MARLTPLTALLACVALLGSCAAPAPAPLQEGPLEVRGALRDQEGRPVEGARVYAYEAGRGNLLGPAEGMSEPAGEDGSYLILLPPGRYRLVARKRAPGSPEGPLREGDLASLPLEAPARGGEAPPLVLRPFRKGEGGPPGKRAENAVIRTGRVVDEEGSPVAGAHAFAYAATFHKGMPNAFSPSTGADGRFTLSLPPGQRFVVGARAGGKGPPSPGDLVGIWRGEPEEEMTIILHPFRGEWR